MTPDRFNTLNKIQTEPKPISYAPLWFVGISYVILVALTAYAMYVHYHPSAEKGGEVLHSTTPESK
jgi:hypothetical protein